MGESNKPIRDIVTVRDGSAVRIGRREQIAPAVVTIADYAIEPVRERCHPVQDVESIINDFVAGIPVIETADEHVCTSLCFAVNGRRGDDHLIAAWADKPFSFALGRQTVDVTANKLFQVGLTLDEKIAVNPREFVCPASGHFERKHLHMLFVDQHDSSSALYSSCDTRHSPGSTSSRNPRYTG